jgi:hypothetical protein
MSKLFDKLSPMDASWRGKVDAFGRYRIQRFILHPELWTACPQMTPPLKWTRIRFSKSAVTQLPNNKYGIYSFIAEPQIAGHNAVGYLLYLGKAQDQSLQARVSSYLYEANKAKPRIHISEMLDHCPDHLWLHYAEIADQKTIKKIEDALLEAFLPPFNRDFPATIRHMVKAVLK